jgi:hypothetical protein
VQELFPIAVGAVIGVAVQWVRNTTIRTIVLVLLCLAFGALASYVSGELEVSLGFISVDTLLVFAGAVAAVVAAAVWRRAAATR